MELTFLGTSNAFGHDGRRRSCYLLEAEYTWLIDAGYDTLPALRSVGKTLDDIDCIIISHLHPDHYLGLPQFLLENYYVIKRTDKIDLYCPDGTESLLRQVSSLLFDETIANHLTDLFSIHEIVAGETYTAPTVTIETFPAFHTGNARCMRIHVDGKTIAYTGDTAFNEELFKTLSSADILITEASSCGFSIPDHVELNELLSFNFPDTLPVYISHVGQSVIDQRDRITPPFYLAEDNMTIYL